MNTKRAKKYVNETIESYELQRSNDIYKTMGLQSILNSYQLFAPNFASLTNEYFTILVILSLTGFTLYSNLYFGHDLTDEINSLKLLRSDLNKIKDEDYEISNTNEKQKYKKN